MPPTLTGAPVAAAPVLAPQVVAAEAAPAIIIQAAEAARSVVSFIGSPPFEKMAFKISLP
jgi:hypothetical protein